VDRALAGGWLDATTETVAVISVFRGRGRIRRVTRDEEGVRIRFAGDGCSDSFGERVRRRIVAKPSMTATHS